MNRYTDNKLEPGEASSRGMNSVVRKKNWLVLKLDILSGLLACNNAESLNAFSTGFMKNLRPGIYTKDQIKEIARMIDTRSEQLNIPVE